MFLLRQVDASVNRVYEKLRAIGVQRRAVGPVWKVNRRQITVLLKAS